MQDENTCAPSAPARRGPDFSTFNVEDSRQPQYPFSTLFVATCIGDACYAVAVRLFGVRPDGMNEDRWCAIMRYVSVFLLGALQANREDFRLTSAAQRPHELDDSALMERIKFLLDAPIEQVRGS